MDLFCGLSVSRDVVLISLAPDAWDSGETKGPDMEEVHSKAKEFGCPNVDADAGNAATMPLLVKLGIDAVTDTLLLENRFVDEAGTGAL